MQMLRIMALLVALTLGYVLFFRSQTPRTDLPPDLARPGLTTTQTDIPAQGTAHDQYKEAMDRAQAAAKAMQDERKEADSY